MTFSRIITKLPTYVGPMARRSRAAAITQASCRGLNHKPFNDTGVQALTHFMGTWVQESHEGYEQVLTAFGVKPDMITHLLNNKTVLRYGKEDDFLTLSLGVNGSEQSPTYRIELGEYFLSDFYDGRRLNSVIFEYEGCLTEQHETVSLPTRFMKLVREVDDSGHRMICTKKVGSNFMKKIYSRKVNKESPVRTVL